MNAWIPYFILYHANLEAYFLRFILNTPEESHLVPAKGHGIGKGFDDSFFPAGQPNQSVIR